MERGNKISSSKDEFDFSLLNNEITSIRRTLDGRGKENSKISSISSYIISKTVKKKNREKNSHC